MRAKNSWNKEYETVEVEQKKSLPDGQTVTKKRKTVRLVRNGLKSSPKEVAFAKCIAKMKTDKKGEGLK